MHVTAKPSVFNVISNVITVFYLEKESQFTHEKWMDDSTLKEFIKQYIAASGNQVYFTRQGGEPTLAGLDFSVKLFTINNAMQAKNVFLMHYKRMAFY